MSVRAEIERRLREGLAPEKLAIVDESARHAGHAGARPEGETHFRPAGVATGAPGGDGKAARRAEEEQRRLERQRLVHHLLADLLRERIHALAIVCRAPGEPGS